MLEFNTKAFFEATTEAQHTLTHIEAHKIASIKRNPDGSVTIDRIEDEVFLDVMLKRAEQLEEQLFILGTESTLDIVERLLVSLRAKIITYEELTSEYHQINSRLRSDLKRTKVFALNDRDKRYFSPREPHFGVEFDTKFRTLGVFELDEAAKCMAFGRPTACVFHLMRLMEVGIQTIAECLSIPPPTRDAERNWGKILGKIKEECDRRNASRAPIWLARGDGAFFASAYVSLDAVRVAWRNPTMHVENKYTDDEADHVFLAVKGFMKTLASRMDEDGEPKA